jgi:heme exporter protein D
MNDFLAMGGYGFYVWGSYGAALAVFLWNAVAPRLERAQVLKRLRAETGKDGAA